MSVTPSDLLADLPDPRDDEPSSLRSDIAEELTDHLVCSVRREMVKGADEPTAWERALKRFGDPRQIARKLWWLAMRRRIMNQRLMLGLQGAMLLAVIAVAAVMIQMSNAQQRQMAQQQELLSAALAKLSERLEAQSAQPASALSDSKHNRVQVRVVEGTEDGPVVKQVHVTLTQPAWSKPLSPVVGPEGLLDFGYLDAGLYTLSASLSWGPTQEHQFVVHPGKEHVETLIAPNPPNQIIAIKVKVPLNAVLKGNGARVALFPVLTALTGPASNWETRKFVRVFRKQAADGSAVPDDRFENGTIALTEWEGDSLTGVMHILPGTYAVRETTLDIGRVRSLNVQQQLQVSLVPFLEPQLRSQKSFTESGQEWQIDLPEDRLKELTRAVETQSRLNLGADRLQTSEPAAASPDPATRDPKHNRVQIRVVEGNADGPVITSATAWLTQPDWEKPLAPVIEDDGTLDFGYLDAGVYSLTTLLKWGPKGERRFVVHPGKNVVETVVAPVSPEHGLEVRIVAPVPAKLREAGVVLQLDPRPAGFAAPFEAWKWGTEGFYDTIRGTAGGGKLPPMLLTEQAGDSLIGTITLPPGTYICPTASLRDRSLKRILAQGKLLNHDHSGIARPNEGIITLTKPDQEWQIDLPTDLVGEAIDALTTAEPASR